MTKTLVTLAITLLPFISSAAPLKAAPKKIQVEFKFDNNGVGETATITTLDNGHAKLESTTASNLRYVISGRPEIVEGKVRLDLRASMSNAKNKESRKLDISVILDPGVETQLAGSANSKGKESFQMTAKATIID